MDPNDYLALFGLTPDQIPPSFSVTQNVQPAPAPEPQSVVQPQPVSPGESVGQSQSQSFRGVTDQGINQSRKVYTGVDGRIAAQTAPLQSEANASMANLGQAKTELSTSRQEQGRLEQEYQTKMAGLSDDKMRFQQGAADTEARIMGENKAMTEAYVGKYRDQISAVRAMAVDPTGPIGSMSTLQAGGLSMAMFAQGFLGAQGIHIDVQSQVDRWVDRSIHEQERRIQQAQAGAEDTLNLWHIARQSSQDDYEARQRYRGFVLAGMMASGESLAARFNAPMAAQRAKEANARLAIELDSTERSIRDGYFNKQHAITQAEYQRAFQQGTLANQSKAESETARHNQAMESMKASNEGKLLAVKDVGDVKIDPKTGKTTSGGRVIAYVDPHNTEAVKAVNGVQQAHGELLRAADALEKMRQEATKDLGTNTGSELVSRVMSEKYRDYSKRRDLLIATIQKSMTGMQATEQERKMFKAELEDDKFFQSGSNANDILHLREWSKDKYANTINNTLGVEIIPEDKRYYSDYADADPTTTMMTDAKKDGTPPLPPGPAGDELAAATNVDSQKAISRGASGPGVATLPGGEQRPTLFFDYAKENKVDEPYKVEHQHMETLAHMVAQPDIFASNEPAEQIKAEATEALQRLSSEDHYAGFLLGVVMKDPQRFLSVFAPQSHDNNPTLESQDALRLR